MELNQNLGSCLLTLPSFGVATGSCLLTSLGPDRCCGRGRAADGAGRGWTGLGPDGHGRARTGADGRGRVRTGADGCGRGVNLRKTHIRSGRVRIGG